MTDRWRCAGRYGGVRGKPDCLRIELDAKGEVRDHRCQRNQAVKQTGGWQWQFELAVSSRD